MRDDETTGGDRPIGPLRGEGVEPLFDALRDSGAGTWRAELAAGDARAGGAADDVAGGSADGAVGNASYSALADGAVPLGVDQALDPRHVAVERIGLAVLTASVSGAGLVAGLVVALTTEPGPLWLAVVAAAWLLVTALLLASVAWWPPLAHRHTSYRVDADGIEIRRGVWWRSVVSVPRSRVQHIDVTQGPLDRRHGLGQLVLHTAGNEYAQVQLDGLDHALALALRDHLLPRGGDDAV